MKKSEKPQKLKSTKSKKDNLDFIPVELRKMVADDVKRFSEILGTNQFEIRIFYSKDTIEDHETFQGSVIGATTCVDVRYLTADIKVYPYLVEQWKKGNMTNNDVHDIIAHEVAHIATSNLRRLALSVFKGEDEVRDAWESLTTTVGRLINKIDILTGDLTNSK